MRDKYYLTTPLYYVNSKPHIGHSYTNIATDALARYRKLLKNDVYFLTGTDEHGQKIDKAATAAGMKPKEFTDRISGTFRDLWSVLNIHYDDFIRTTEDRHIRAVQAVWRDLEKKGRLYKAGYQGWYCTPDETFFTEGQVVHENGATLCPDCKRPVEKIEEENYFLKMSDRKDWLIKLIRDAKQMVVLPETRRNEVLGFLENNDLQDLCISRPKTRLTWGIPSPISEAHVTYVWFDALINYIAAVGYGDDKGHEKFARWWPADVHLIGKDILRHHAVYWPIILEGLGIPPPKMIFAHGWWVQGGEKMSKSRGNVVDPVEIVKIYGVDPYRYFLLSETPFGSDGTFSEEALISRYNTALANDVGNLLHRSLTMCEKYFEGKVPATAPGALIDESTALIVDSGKLVESLKPFMDKLDFSGALDEIWKLTNRANKHIEKSAPWTLAKEGKTDELRLVIKSLLVTLKGVAQAVWPFLPATGEGIWAQLGIEEPILVKPFDEDFPDVATVKKGAPLFPRIESEEEKARKLQTEKPKKKG
jgi:methionyl-tRNA synthetase